MSKAKTSVGTRRYPDSHMHRRSSGTIAFTSRQQLDRERPISRWDFTATSRPLMTRSRTSGGCLRWTRRPEKSFGTSDTRHSAGCQRRHHAFRHRSDQRFHCLGPRPARELHANADHRRQSSLRCLDNGVLTSFDAKTGAISYSERLGSGSEGFAASPVSDGHHLFFASEVGNVYVVRADGKFSVVATNKLGETCMATPAISEGALFFRTRQYITAVGK